MSSSLYLLIGLAFLGACLADYPLYIDELEEIVQGPDRRLLDMLDDDEYSPRTEIKEKFDIILERQSDVIKKRYAEIIEMIETRRHYWENIRRSNLHLEDRETYDKIRSVLADLSLSERQAKIKSELMWRHLHASQSLRNGYGSHSGSSEEDDFRY